MESSKLCYVDEDGAYFTTQDLALQWGDDWDDAPYEHNASAPYPASRRYSHYVDGKWVKGSDYVDGLPLWRVYCVPFAAPVFPPCHGHMNSPWSVEQINAGAVAWLVTEDKGVKIMAGTTLADFRAIIASIGGTVEDVQELRDMP